MRLASKVGVVPLVSLGLAACVGTPEEIGGPAPYEAGMRNDARVDTSPGLPDAGPSSEPDVPSLPPTVDATTDRTPPSNVPDARLDARVEASSDAPPSLQDTGPSDAPRPWPTCVAAPAGAKPMTIAEVWAADYATPEYVWVEGVYVTAISQGGCAPQSPCQVFLADATTYATLADSARHAIKLFVARAAAERFTGLSVGDRIDVAAYGFRNRLGSANEIILQVSDGLRGCGEKKGAGTVAPVAATLADLGSIEAYESTIGPVLVTLSNVSGRPTGVPTETFGLWNTGMFDGGSSSSTIVSLSPYFLAGGAFDWAASTSTMNFASVTGVFGLYMPTPGDAGSPPKYLEIYPRSPADIVTK